MSISTTPEHTERQLRIAVVIGSTRQGRAGEPIARWFVDQVSARDDIELDLIDLAEADVPHVMPDFDDETLPDSVEALGARLDAADGFVVVTPEYNHSFPASLKNAIDWFHDEWHAKPVAFVSYGGMGRGFRAVEQLRQVLVELHAMTTRDGVSIDLDEVDDHGRPTSDGIEGAAKLMVDQLIWWATALRAARDARPYVG